MDTAPCKANAIAESYTIFTYFCDQKPASEISAVSDNQYNVYFVSSNKCEHNLIYTAVKCDVKFLSNS